MKKKLIIIGVVILLITGAFIGKYLYKEHKREELNSMLKFVMQANKDDAATWHGRSTDAFANFLMTKDSNYYFQYIKYEDTLKMLHAHNDSLIINLEK
jgi:hypothetical protein